MSEITITIPYWLPSTEGALRFLVFYVMGGNAAFLLLLGLTRNNRRYGLAPSLLRAKSGIKIGVLVACFLTVWPLALIMHSINFYKLKRKGGVL